MRIAENWYVGDAKSIWGFYSVISETDGELIAVIKDYELAKSIAQLPQLKKLRCDWALIINRLAFMAIEHNDGSMPSNDMNFAEDMMTMACSYLGCVEVDNG